MSDELARIEKLAVRARELAKYASNERTRNILLAIVADYERLIAQLSTERNATNDQPN